jgi:5'-nucleotidase
MRILLTNDDGIYAEGLFYLYREMKKEEDVTVVAPESEQSAVGHAITILNPLRVKKVKKNGNFFGYAVNGTPADCVKIAVSEIMEKPPEMVISGINLGANVGINVIYSGTVSAAAEGTILGIPSIAVSLNTLKDPDYSHAARFIRTLALLVNENGLSEGTVLNVNIPALPASKIKGVVITRQGRSRFIEKFEKRMDPQNNIYYWQVGKTVLVDEDAEVDSKALASDMISITPIYYDLTSLKEIEKLRRWKVSKVSIKLGDDN